MRASTLRDPNPQTLQLTLLLFCGRYSVCRPSGSLCTRYGPSGYKLLSPVETLSDLLFGFFVFFSFSTTKLKPEVLQRFVRKPRNSHIPRQMLRKRVFDPVPPSFLSLELQKWQKGVPELPEKTIFLSNFVFSYTFGTIFFCYTAPAREF